MAKSTLAPTYQISNNTTMPTPNAQVHDRFALIEIHTAKCDFCDQRNMATIYRCLTCGQQICTPCVERTAGTDATHVLKYIIPPMVSSKKRKKLLQQSEDETNEAKRRKARVLRKESDDDQPIESDETQVYVEAGTPRSYAAFRHQSSAEKIIPNSRNAQANGSSHQLQFALREKPQAPESYNYPHTPPSENHSQNRVHPKSTIIPLSSRGKSAESPSIQDFGPTPSTVRPARVPAATALGTYTSTIPRYLSDHDGILALLQAAEYIEKYEKTGQWPFPLPTTLSTPSPSVSQSSCTTLGNKNPVVLETASHEAIYNLTGKWPYPLPPRQSIPSTFGRGVEISRNAHKSNDCYHSPSKGIAAMYIGVVRNDTLFPQAAPSTLTSYVADECIFPTPPRKPTPYAPAEVVPPMTLPNYGRKVPNEDEDTNFPVPRRSLTPYIYERPEFPVPPRTGTPDGPGEEKESNYPVFSQASNLSASEHGSGLHQDAQARSPLFAATSSDVDLKTQSSLGLTSQNSCGLLAQAAIEAGVERDLFQTEYGKASLQKLNIENDSDATISINGEECTVMQQKNKGIALVDYDETEDELEPEEIQEDTRW